MSLLLPVTPDVRKAIMRLVALCLLFCSAVPAIACTPLSCPLTLASAPARPGRMSITLPAATRAEQPAAAASLTGKAAIPQPERREKVSRYSSSVIIVPTICLLSLLCLSLAGIIRLPAPLTTACSMLLDLFTTASLYLLITHRLHGNTGKVHLLLNARTLLLAGLLLLHAYLEQRKNAGLLAAAPVRRIREKLQQAGLALLAAAKRRSSLLSA